MFDMFYDYSMIIGHWQTHLFTGECKWATSFWADLNRMNEPFMHLKHITINKKGQWKTQMSSRNYKLDRNTVNAFLH